MGSFGLPRRGRGYRSGGGIRPTFGDVDDFRPQKPDYKTMALCKQVRRTLALTLSGECGDPVLQELIVLDVLPAPNASRLLVRVVARGDGPGVVDILERLAKVEGLLRARVGEGIVRKRTPELTFLIVPADATGPAEEAPHA